MVEALRIRVAATKCPACQQQTLTLATYTNVVNPIKQTETKDGKLVAKGWDASVTCSNCSMTGVVNSTGFEYKGLTRRVKKE